MKATTLLLALSALLLSPGRAGTIEYSICEDYDPPYYVPAIGVEGIYGAAPPQIVSGGPWGKFYRLVPVAPLASHNEFAFNALSAGVAGYVEAGFNFRMVPSSLGANGHGFAIAFANVDVYGTTGTVHLQGPGNEPFTEEPNLPGTLAFGFDTHENRGPDRNDNHISIHFDGHLQNVVNVPFDMNNGNWYEVKIEAELTTGRIEIYMRDLGPTGHDSALWLTLLDMYHLWLEHHLYPARLAITARHNGLVGTPPAPQDHDFDNVCFREVLSPVVPTPTIVCNATGNYGVLEWPVHPSPLVVEETDHLAVWANSDAVVGACTGSTCQATDATGGDLRFYRLRDDSTVPPRYSEVVGVQVIHLSAGFQMIANQWGRSDGYALGNGVLTVGNGVSPLILYKYDPATGFSTTTYVAGIWTDPTVTLGIGEGAFVRASSAGVVCTCGTLLESAVVPLATGFSIVSVPWPVSATPVELNFPAADGDQIYKYNPAVGYSTYAYDGEWLPEPPIIWAGEGWWIRKMGDALDWNSKRPAALP